jgi:hypothetical protein
LKLPVIALKGKGGSGKSTAAGFLLAKGYAKVSFAAPLKRMIETLGLSPDEMGGHLKEQPCAILSGASPRAAMQTLGTEWGRSLHPDFWVNIWTRRAKEVLAKGYGVVVDDCRFENEAAAVRALGGYVVEVVNARQPARSVGIVGHVSEDQDFDPDVVVVNDGRNLAILRAELEGALFILENEADDAAHVEQARSA